MFDERERKKLIAGNAVLNESLSNMINENLTLKLTLKEVEMEMTEKNAYIAQLEKNKDSLEESKEKEDLAVLD